MRMQRFHLLVALAGLAAAQTGLLATQSPAGKTFEAVSIKRSAADARGTSLGVQAGGRFVLRNMSIAALVGSAYPSDISEYPGAPEWMMKDRYDIEAVAAPGTARDEIEPMLRTLLAERFNFKGRYETQDRPVYELVLARPAGGVPPALQKVDVDCDGRRNASTRGEKVPELPRRANGTVPCGYGMSAADSVQITSGGITMTTLGRSIQGMAGRIVLDKTGLAGYYEFTLSFTANPGPNSDIADIFTALQEQLGLKLESARGPVRVMAVDHIDRPTEN